MRTIYKNLLKSCPCNGCHSWDICYLQKMPLSHYPENVQNFVISMPYAFIGYQKRTRLWVANYQAVQERLVQYYNLNNCTLLGNGNHGVTNEAQKESDRQKIRESLKQFLEIAAKVSEDKDPQMSIVFDEIGLILASDYLEAVNKIFSMLKTLNKINNNFSGRCFGY